MNMQTDLAAVKSAPTVFSPPVIPGKYRLVLWVLLLAITAALVLFPANLKYEYSLHALPFLYIFESPALFAALYYVWLALLLALLFTGGTGKHVDWEKAALLGIFALVYTGYSAFMSRALVGDAFAPASDIKTLIAQGQYNDAPSLKYNGFPGFALLGTGVCLVTGMEITDYMAFFPLFQVLLFSMLLYLFFSRLLKNPYFAALGVMLVVQADLSISTSLPQFHGGVFAPYILLSAAFLLIAAGEPEQGRRRFRLETNEALILAVLAALYISHFITSVVAFLTILGIFVIQKLSRRRILSAPLVAVLILVPLIWNLVENLSIIKYLAGLVPEAVSVFFSGDILNSWLLPMQTNTYIGERAVLWSIPPLILGPFLIIVIGSVLGLARLFKIRRVDNGEVVSLGGLSGIVLLAFVLLFLGGLQESYGRTLLYIAFFTVPMILWYIFRLGRFRAYVFSLLVAVLLVFSLPSFFLSNKAIAAMTYYPSEIASGDFLESTFGRGSAMHVYGVGAGAYYLVYYLPDARMNYAYVPDFRSREEGDIWQGVNGYVSTFGKAQPVDPARPRPSILMFSPKWDAPFRDYLGIDVKDSPRWHELASRLAEHDLIYSNSFVHIYYTMPEGKEVQGN